ncbi:hypothetical protein ABZ816_13445 [Actinosynnema sp. NPDC047251]|uniref:Uncharacterized protein n=1 Tax=Saccharothrix espanaensis (strain ATCC 51144 / DSM 44229 / JCM 9112 / NBRC 15066 / NRRL 15764) TaxID=1179773 RepID=K0K5S4_SACES|nr:hypothetical protein [Saccharothrix espanaensis]CCH35600.1 hypothetical protein BN6_83840 [Saccharothrix espanaensis DSM 44229]
MAERGRDDEDREQFLDGLVDDEVARGELRESFAAAGLSRHDLVEAVRAARLPVFAAAHEEEARYWRLLAPGPAGSGARAGFAVAVAVAVGLHLVLAAGLVVKAADRALGLAGMAVLGALALVVALAVEVSGSSVTRHSRGVAAAFVPFPLVAVALEGLDTVARLPVVPLTLIGVGAVFAAFARLTLGLRSQRRDDLAAAFRDWARALRRDGVLPVLRARLDEATEAVCSTSLTVRDASALDDVRAHVPTPAAVELAGLLDRRTGGTFAVTGARGVGKTDLLRAVCAGHYREPDRLPDLAVLVAAPVDYLPREFLVDLFARTCEAAIAHLPAGEPPRGLAKLRRRVAPPRLVAAAKENLLVLAHVRSTDRVLRHPELVTRFRDFLALAVAEQTALGERADRTPGRVIIAVDELDRIGTGEPARRFLAELKAVFDVPGCHYLVSVSTEAQLGSYRSGIGPLSVFDGSFDEVVRVGHLDLDHAKKLVRRYVVGLPEQYLALAHVLSGGLARQLFRATRAIVDLGRDQPDRSIEEVVRVLADTELHRARRSTAEALTAVDDRAGATAFLLLLDQGPALSAERVLNAYQGLSTQVGELRDALAARIRFLETVRGVFTADLDEARTRATDFDRLALARRHVGGNPAAALALLDDLRADPAR